MSAHGIGSEQGTPPGAGTIPSAPPTVYVSHFGLAVNVNELSLICGHMRQIIDPNTGAPSARPGVEWLFSLSIAPPIAVLVSEALAAAIRDYENRYGKIPKDPASGLQTNALP